MEWIWVIVAAGAALYFWKHWRPRTPPALPESSPIGMSIASDREILLGVLRRELANYLVRHDPDRFLNLYRKARAVETAIETGDRVEREALLTILTKKYRYHEEFNLIGTRDHVLYSDALSTHLTEEIEEHYINLVKFQALQRALNSDWEFRGAATTDRDLEHLERYVRKIKDTRFLQRLMEAIEQYFTHWIDRFRKLDRYADAAVDYETNLIAVYRVPHFAENRYGVYFKDTDESGLYGSFSSDEGRVYEGYYRSDRNFETEKSLDYLPIDEKI